MNYLLKSSNFADRKRQARNKVLIISVVIIILIIIFLTRPVRQTLFAMANPVWKIKSLLANSSLGEYFKFKSTLITEKQAMEQKLFLAGNLLAINESLQAENEMLKNLLGRDETRKAKTILAAVLVKPPQTLYDMLTVDVGSQQGVKIGDQVIANGDVYIGKVSEVYADTAKIVLYSTPGHKLSVVLGLSSVNVEAVGVGGGNFNIFLPREVEVKEGDVIVIPAITSNVFGIVEKVSFKDKDSTQTVLFKSPVNISELRFVEIIL